MAKKKQRESNKFDPEKAMRRRVVIEIEGGVPENHIFANDEQSLAEIDGYEILEQTRTYEYVWLLGRITRDDVVLDAGCGFCELPHLLAPRCKELHILDKDQVSLRLMKNEIDAGPSVNTPGFVLANFIESNSWLKTHSFDVIVCCGVIHELEVAELIAAFSEFARILKPAGKILITFKIPMNGLQHCGTKALTFNDFTTAMRSNGLELAGLVQYPFDFTNKAEPLGSVEKNVAIFSAHIVHSQSVPK